MKKVLLASMLLLPVSSSWAVQNIKFGGVAINPTIDVQQSYDDNIYLTGSRALPAYRPFANKSSNIKRSSLGIQAEKPLGSRLDLTAGYTFEVLTYSRAPGINNAVHNLANVGLKADLPRNSTLAIKDDYMHTTDQKVPEKYFLVKK